MNSLAEKIIALFHNDPVTKIIETAEKCFTGAAGEGSPRPQIPVETRSPT